MRRDASVARVASAKLKDAANDRRTNENAFGAVKPVPF